MAEGSALVLRSVGQPPTLEPIETPAPRSGEALVRLEFAGLNHRDLFLCQGRYAGIELPCVLGSDGYGRVEAVGSGVDAAWVGRPAVIYPVWEWGEDDAAPGPRFRILGMPDPGTFARYICVPVTMLFPAPAGYAPEEAAILPLGGLTAHRALFRRGGLRAGEKVLVTGVGGGVAQLLLRFAVAAGAEVWVTAGTPVKLAGALELGAQGGVLYANPAWPQELLAAAGPFDLCVDSAAGPVWAGLCDVLKPAGRLVFFGVTLGLPSDLPLRKAFFKQLSFLGTTMGSPRDFAAMLAFVLAHGIKPALDSVWPLEKFGEALARLDQGLQTGKVALRIP